MTTWTDPTGPLAGARLTLRPLTPGDRDALYAAAGDPEVWAQHPAHDRHERKVFDAYVDFLLAAGGVWVAEETATGRVIGCSRFYAAPGQPDDVAIGFTFLARDRWGGAWNREMKGLMLEHAFRHVARVWFHVAPGNVRSQVATSRLGAVLDHEAVLDLGTGPAKVLCYRLDRVDWRS